MNIRATVPKDLFPKFIDTSVNLLDILVKSVLACAHAVNRQRRGNVPVCLCAFAQNKYCTPLQGIFLSNVRSLCNKQDKL